MQFAHACIKSAQLVSDKNAQLVSSLQTSCHKSVHKLLQVCSQVVNKFSLHCLLPVVATSLEQVVNCNF